MPVSIYRHAKSLDAAQQGRSALRVSGSMMASNDATIAALGLSREETRRRGAHR
ncbi:hypothetical protein [Rhizobium sp. SG2393]|uniref:hypothetical protein n=1 Tax=Rhizobium sp. SG2393 TaxID=3276279 RepID=UPI00366E709D